MSRKEKILFLCQYFYPETLSSAVLPYELASKFSADGYDVSAMVGYPNEYIDTKYVCPSQETVKNIKIKRLKYSGLNRHKALGRIANILSFSFAVFMHPKRMRLADTYICTTNPPLLPFTAALYAKLFHKKLFIIMYDLYPDSVVSVGYLKKTSFIVKAFECVNQFAFRNATGVIALSSEMKDYLVRNKKIPSGKVAIIPNWYQDCHRDDKYDVSLPLHIVYGGNMGEGQEFDTLLSAINALKEDERFKFTFIGQGSQKQKIKTFIKENRISNCECKDFIPKDEYDKLLNHAHLAVMTLKESECGLGSPSKFYGYLAAKKPVVAVLPESMDVAKDLKDYRAGICVSNGDSEQLVHMLLGLADNPGELKEMSNHAYQLFLEKYTLDKCYQKYEKLVRS